MGDGADQDRHITDNHLYAALLDKGHVFDNDKAYRVVDEGQGNTADDDNCDASANSDYEQNINIIDCQNVS